MYVLVSGKLAQQAGISGSSSSIWHTDHLDDCLGTTKHWSLLEVGEHQHSYGS